jgi:hypothetical protein
MLDSPPSTIINSLEFERSNPAGPFTPLKEFGYRAVKDLPALDPEVLLAIFEKTAEYWVVRPVKALKSFCQENTRMSDQKKTQKMIVLVFYSTVAELPMMKLN